MYIFFNVHNMIKDLFKKHIFGETYISIIAFLNNYVFCFIRISIVITKTKIIHLRNYLDLNV